MNKKLVRTLLRVSSRQQLHGDDIPLQRAETKILLNNIQRGYLTENILKRLFRVIKMELRIDKCSWKYLKMQESMNLISC